MHVTLRQSLDPAGWTFYKQHLCIELYAKNYGLSAFSAQSGPRVCLDTLEPEKALNFLLPIKYSMIQTWNRGWKILSCWCSFVSCYTASCYQDNLKRCCHNVLNPVCASVSKRFKNLMPIRGSLVPAFPRTSAVEFNFSLIHLKKDHYRTKLLWLNSKRICHAKWLLLYFKWPAKINSSMWLTV